MGPWGLKKKGGPIYHSSPLDLPLTHWIILRTSVIAFCTYTAQQKSKDPKAVENESKVVWILGITVVCLIYSIIWKCCTLGKVSKNRHRRRFCISDIWSFYVFFHARLNISRAYLLCCRREVHSSTWNSQTIKNRVLGKNVAVNFSWLMQRNNSIFFV